MEPQREQAWTSEGMWWVASVMTNTDICLLLVMLWVIFSLWIWVGLMETDCCWSNGTSLPRLSYKSIGFYLGSFFLSRLLTWREASFHVIKAALWKDSCGEGLGEGCCQKPARTKVLSPTAMQVNLEALPLSSDEITAPTNSLTATSWGVLSQRQSSGSHVISDSQKLWDGKCFVI